MKYFKNNSWLKMSTISYFERNNEREIAVADATFKESIPVFETEGIVIVLSTILRTSFDIP